MLLVVTDSVRGLAGYAKLITSLPNGWCGAGVFLPYVSRAQYPYFRVRGASLEATQLLH